MTTVIFTVTAANEDGWHFCTYEQEGELYQGDDSRSFAEAERLAKELALELGISDYIITCDQ